MEYRFRLLLACLISPLMTIPSVAHPSVAHPSVAHPSVAQTRDEVLSAIAAQSPQSALASAPTSPPPTTSSPTLPDWMWWLILSTIPLAVLGAILYGFQRVNQQTNSQTNLQINSQANQRTTHRKSTHQKTESAKHQGRSAQRSSFLRGKSAFAAAKGAKTNRNQSKRADNTTLDTPLNDTTGLEQKSDLLEPSSGQPLELAEHSNQQSVSEESIHEGFIHKESIHELGDLTVSETTRLSRVDIVDELIQDLQSADASRRRKAIWELGQRGDSRAVQPLVDLLMDSDSQQRSLILAAVSEIGIRTLKPMNRALFMSVQDDSAEVRKNAIRDVTRVFDLVTQMSQLLQYATSDEDREVQETAEWALEQLNRIRPLPGTEGLPRLGDRDLPSIDASADPRLPFPPELD